MRVVCAWCQREGQPALLGERAPFDSAEETHGICRRHAAQVFAQLPAPSYPDIRLLLVVDQRETRLYEHLVKTFSRVPDVTVIVERRRVQRRGRARDFTPERRQTERRIRRGEELAFGYTVYRFRPVRKAPPIAALQP